MTATPNPSSGSNPGSNQSPSQPERLPQRWGLIFIGASVAGAVGFAIGGPLVAFGAAAGAISLLHQILA